AQQVGRSQSAVTRVTQRYDIKTFHRVTPPLGPQKSIDEHEQRTIVHQVHKNRQASLFDITNVLPEKISMRTLQRRLDQAGIQKHLALKKPFLSSEHMRARLEWAMERKDWTIEDWNKVIFSDESKVEIGKILDLPRCSEQRLRSIIWTV